MQGLIVDVTGVIQNKEFLLKKSGLFGIIDHSVTRGQNLGALCKRNSLINYRTLGDSYWI